jgi:hypothetical protein
MNIQERAESAAAGVIETLAASPTEAQTKKVTQLIERVVIDAMIEEGKRCAGVARECGVADRDVARRVAHEIRVSNEALIANLSSLR